MTHFAIRFAELIFHDYIKITRAHQEDVLGALVQDCTARTVARKLSERVWKVL